MQEQIERDLKTALLSGDRLTAETLKTIKSALQYEALNHSVKPAEMTDEQIQLTLSREAKKRQEAADMYAQAGEDERRQKEMDEKAIIDSYLPEKMPEQDLIKLVEAEVAKVPAATISDMGKIIGSVRAIAGASSDGALIARLVKEKLKVE
jgi:uncharacterized protein YqeY